MTGADWLRLALLAGCAALIFPAAARLPWRSHRILSYAAIWIAVFAVSYLAWQIVGDRGNCRLSGTLFRVVNLDPACRPPGY